MTDLPERSLNNLRWRVIATQVGPCPTCKHPAESLIAYYKGSVGMDTVLVACDMGHEWAFTKQFQLNGNPSNMGLSGYPGAMRREVAHGA